MSNRRTLLRTIITASTRFATRITLKNPVSHDRGLGQKRRSPIIRQPVLNEGLDHMRLPWNPGSEGIPSTIYHKYGYNCVI